MLELAASLPPTISSLPHPDLPSPPEFEARRISESSINGVSIEIAPAASVSTPRVIRSDVDVRIAPVPWLSSVFRESTQSTRNRRPSLKRQASTRYLKLSQLEHRVAHTPFAWQVYVVALRYVTATLRAPDFSGLRITLVSG